MSQNQDLVFSILGGFEKFLGVSFGRVTWGEINTWMVPG